MVINNHSYQLDDIPSSSLKKNSEFNVRGQTSLLNSEFLKKKKLAFSFLWKATGFTLWSNVIIIAIRLINIINVCNKKFYTNEMLCKTVHFSETGDL